MQLQAGQPRRLRDTARPWWNGDLTGARSNDHVETSPEPFRHSRNAGARVFFGLAKKFASVFP